MPSLAYCTRQRQGRDRGEIITTYALLDNGPTSTWCSEGSSSGLAGVVRNRKIYFKPLLTKLLIS